MSAIKFNNLMQKARLPQSKADEVKKAVAKWTQKQNLKKGAEKLRESMLRDSFTEGARKNLPVIQEALARTREPVQPQAPAAPALPQQSMSYDGGMTYQPGVEALQQNLVAAGYMTEEEMATGPGYYGPRTQAAVARMQADHGIASDGSIFGPQSHAALTDAVARKGGVATTPAAPGSTTTDPGTAPAVPGAPGIDPTAPTQAPGATDGVFAEVPLMDQRWPNGATSSNYWNGESNCGPTSAAMVARALGKGEGLSDAELVMQMYHAGGTTAAGSSPEQVATMVRSLGVGATVVEDPGLAELDAAIAEGKLVIVNGDYFATGIGGRDGSKESGHFTVVSGKDANGNYIMNEPYGAEKLTLSPEAMSNYFTEHAYDGAMVVVDQPVTNVAATTPAAPTTPVAPVDATGEVELSAADLETAGRVDALLSTYQDSAMHGMGKTIVAACRRERVPLDLVLAQLGKESTFLRSDNTLSIANNNAGNLRFAEWEREFGGEPGVGGFTRFPTVADGINAYVHLLGSPDLPYRELVDNRDWQGLVEIFAPASDGNDVATYVAQINEWTEYFGNKVGVDENWVNEA